MIDSSYHSGFIFDIQEKKMHQTSYYLVLIFFLAVFFPYNALSENDIGEIKIVTVQNNNPPTAKGMVDIKVHYKDIYKCYKNKIDELEDDYFDKRVFVKHKEDTKIYDLIFSYTFGELFRIREEHTHFDNAEWRSETDFAMSGLESAPMWYINKYLRPETKSMLVGDNLKTLKAIIAFIDLGKNRGRLYYKMALDARDNRNISQVKKTLYEAIKDIVNITNSSCEE